jgi:hypothetical protein
MSDLNINQDEATFLLELEKRKWMIWNGNFQF